MSVNHPPGKGERERGRIPWAAVKALPDRWDWNESLVGFAIEEEWEMDILR